MRSLQRLPFSLCLLLLVGPVCVLTAAGLRAQADSEPVKQAFIRILHPDDGARLEPGRVVVIEAQAVDPDGDIRRLEFFANDVAVGVSEFLAKIAVIPGRPIPHRLEWTPAAGEYRLVAVGTSTAGQRVVSPSVTVRVGGGGDDGWDGERTVLVPRRSAWRYVADGGEPAEGWTGAGFDDSAWQTGGAPLGYGDGDEATVIRAEGPPHPMSAHFRHVFEVSGDAAVSNLLVRLQRDDGAIVYLDGREVVRDNMPDGAVGATTPAAGTTDDENGYRRHWLDGVWLAPGRHVLAVEVHQASATSSDLSLDLELTAGRRGVEPGLSRVGVVATRPVTSEPRPEARVAPGQVTIRRTGNVSWPLAVRLQIGGSAEAGADYGALPARVILEAGESEQTLEIAAAQDGFLEGPETVRVEVLPVMELSAWWPYEVDPAAAVAEVRIEDADLPATSAVQIRKPRDGAQYREGQTLVLEAAAYDPAGYIPRVEFMEGDRSLGVSQIAFLVPPPAGSVIVHTLEWKEPPVGAHLIHAVAVDSAGTRIRSEPVTVEVVATPVVNRPPRVKLLAPEPRSVFTEGETIRIRAEASDPDGKVVRLELLADGVVVAGSSEAQVEHAWTGVAPGMHKVAARGVDDDGAETVVAAEVYVRDTLERAFVRRDLPAAYLSGREFEVRLMANPPAGAAAWTVTDVPPKGWAVSGITDDGAWDAVHGWVKFGPYVDARSRELSYRVMVPAGTTGPQKFSGSASLNGVSYPIGGDVVVIPEREMHPADAKPADWVIEADELTAYAGAWRTGTGWGGSGTPIPVSYVTRAGLIWRSGERYRYDPASGVPPECWVPLAPTDPAVPGRRPMSVSAAVAERSIPASWKPGVGALVTIQLRPKQGVASVAVEEVLPTGWEAREVSDDGVYDPVGHRVRWGLFHGDAPRRLTYVAVPPAGASWNGAFAGVASVDGWNSGIRGAWHVGAADELTRVRIRGARKEGSRMRFDVEAAAGQVIAVEASSDLVTWTEVGAQVCAEGTVEVDDARGGAEAQRYYRLKPVGR